MKKLTIIFSLLVSTIIFSSPSYAEWTKLYVNDIGNTYYLDFEKIRKVDAEAAAAATAKVELKWLEL